MVTERPTLPFGATQPAFFGYGGVLMEILRFISGACPMIIRSQVTTLIDQSLLNFDGKVGGCRRQPFSFVAKLFKSSRRFSKPDLFESRSGCRRRGQPMWTSRVLMQPAARPCYILNRSQYHGTKLSHGFELPLKLLS